MGLGSEATDFTDTFDWFPPDRRRLADEYAGILRQRHPTINVKGLRKSPMATDGAGAPGARSKCRLTLIAEAGTIRCTIA